MKPTASELAFIDDVGRRYARQYGLPPMTGRVMGYLFICDPPQQTAAEIAEALEASRSAVGNAVAALENSAMARRVRVPGERADRMYADPDVWIRSLDPPDEYVALRALALAGLEAMGDGTPERRARLVELAAFAEFLVEETPRMAAAWRARREALRASGELPPR